MDSNIVAIFGILIPITGILIVPIIIWLIARAVSRDKAEVQLTLRAMIENGQTLSPELLEKLQTQAKPVDKKDKDLRWGVIIVALSLGVILIGLLNGEAIIQVGIGHIDIGLALLILGLARLLLWKFASPKTEDKTD